MQETVEQAAANGSGPAAGSRVVGLVPSGSWAEFVAVPTSALAPLPDAVSYSDAATLPVAGLTALHAVAKGTGLLARKVLVTGATGGVGLFACRIAQLSGARVFAHISRPEHNQLIEKAGAEQAIVTPDGSEAASSGPYRLIVESVGGQVLANTLGMLAVDGVCVSFGSTSDAKVTFNLWSLARTGRASLYGLSVFRELEREPAGIGLTRLAYLVGTQQLRPHISVEAPWTDISRWLGSSWSVSLSARLSFTLPSCRNLNR